MRTVLRRLVPAATILAVVAVAVPLAGADGPQGGLRAEYFDGADLTGKVAERTDATVDFGWGLGEPVDGVGDTFSVRWTGVVTPRYSERYKLITRSDDGVRLWVDGKLVIDDWVMHSALERTGEIDFVAGRAYDIRLEYFDASGQAVAKLAWASASQQREIIPASALAPQRPAGLAVQPAAPEETLREDAVAYDPETGEPVAAAPEIPFAPLAPPVAGETFNATPSGGDVLVRRPEDGALVPLEEGASLPVGTRIDTRDGEVELQTAPAAGVVTTTQEATFHGAMFRVAQPRRGRRIVELDLQHGDFESCGSDRARRRARRSRSTARAAGARRSGRVVRQLFGKGKGRFRTRGRHAAATVRGTSWQIADRCDETVVKVTEGLVEVEDLVRDRTVMVGAGERYAARRR